MRSLRVQQITREGDAAYDVMLLEDPGHTIRTFRFRVRDGKIQVVMCSRDFDEYMLGNPSAAKVIYEVVLAVHRSSVELSS